MFLLKVEAFASSPKINYMQTGKAVCDNSKSNLLSQETGMGLEEFEAGRILQDLIMAYVYRHS